MAAIFSLWLLYTLVMAPSTAQTSNKTNSSTSQRHQLYIGAFFDLDSPNGLGTQPAAIMAVDEINNNTQYLKDYELVLEERSSKVSRDVRDISYLSCLTLEWLHWGIHLSGMGVYTFIAASLTCFMCPNNLFSVHKALVQIISKEPSDMKPFPHYQSGIYEYITHMINNDKTSPTSLYNIFYN